MKKDLLQILWKFLFYDKISIKQIKRKQQTMEEIKFEMKDSPSSNEDKDEDS